MSRYAIVQDGQVVNVVVWDGNKKTWAPAEGCTAYKLPDDSPVGPGWTRARNGRFVQPVETEAPAEQVPVTVDPAALAAFVQAVADPDIDTRQALADFAEALNSQGG